MRGILIGLIKFFGHCFKGLELLDEVFGKEIPEEWLQSLAQLHLTPEEKKKSKLWGLGKANGDP